MKRKIISVMLTALMTLSLLSACASTSDTAEETTAPSETATKEDTTSEPKGLTSVTLCEVAHSIFYAPMYVAIQEGYFEEEGIDLTLNNGFGADKVMTAVLSGETDIGFMGSESTIYTYQEGANDIIVNFAQLTQRAGNFLVAREEMPDFTWEDLKGQNVLGGRKGDVYITM